MEEPRVEGGGIGTEVSCKVEEVVASIVARATWALSLKASVSELAGKVPMSTI